jgi:hypothetical protein
MAHLLLSGWMWQGEGDFTLAFERKLGSRPILHRPNKQVNTDNKREDSSFGKLGLWLL